MANGINWFKLNRSLHRDIGYFCIGLTLIFAVSGIALNHIADWNPNYQVSQTTIKVNGVRDKIEQPDIDEWLFNQLKIKTTVKATFWPNPSTYKIFTTDNHTLIISIPDEQVTIEQVSARPIFKQINALHLNDAKQAWTYFSDFYAVLLIFLALSALFMVKGKHGVIGARGLLVVLGFLIPIGFVLVYSQ